MTTNDGLVQRSSLAPRERADVVALAARCNAYDHLELKLTIGDPPDDVRAGGNDFLCYADGALVGYCALDAGGEVELCGMVHPEYRRRGIGTALLAAAMAECRQRGIGHLLIICEQASHAGRAFVAQAGAQYRFGELRMHLDISSVRAGPPADTRLSLGVAGPRDAATVARIIAASFDDPEEMAQRRVERDLLDPRGHFYLARLAGQPVGALRAVDDMPNANIYAFGVLPAYRRRGLGRQLLTETIKTLQAEGYTSVGLEVETENAPAIALYRSCGFAETTTYGYYRLEL